MKKLIALILVTILLIPSLAFGQGWVKLSDGTYAKTDISETITIEDIDMQIEGLTQAIKDLPALRVYDGQDSGIQEIVDEWNRINVEARKTTLECKLSECRALKTELQAL